MINLSFITKDISGLSITCILCRLNYNNQTYNLEKGTTSSIISQAVHVTV